MAKTGVNWFNTSMYFNNKSSNTSYQQELPGMCSDLVSCIESEPGSDECANFENDIKYYIDYHVAEEQR